MSAGARAGRYAEAVEDYSEALKLEPDNANARHNRGSALEKMGRDREALHDFTEAIRCGMGRGPCRGMLVGARGGGQRGSKSV